MLHFFFHNYDVANETFKQLRNTLKSNQYKERVKEIRAICKCLSQKKESKKEFNFMEEFNNITGTIEQIMRVRLIIIKLMESKIKLNKGDNSSNFKLLTDMVIHIS